MTEWIHENLRPTLSQSHQGITGAAGQSSSHARHRPATRFTAATGPDLTLLKECVWLCKVCCIEWLRIWTWCVCACVRLLACWVYIFVFFYCKMLVCVSRNRRCEGTSCRSSPQTLAAAPRFHSPCRPCAWSADIGGSFDRVREAEGFNYHSSAEEEEKKSG